MSPDFLSSLSYQLAGVIIVVGSLSFLAVAVTLIGKAIRLQEAPVAPPKAATTAVEDSSDAIPPEVRVVIAAAVVATLDSSFHIVEISTASDVRLQAWSLEGRRQIFSSHAVR